MSRNHIGDLIDFSYSKRRTNTLWASGTSVSTPISQTHGSESVTLRALSAPQSEPADVALKPNLLSDGNENRPHSGSANAVNVVPEGIKTNWRFSNIKVIAAAPQIREPV